MLLKESAQESAEVNVTCETARDCVFGEIVKQCYTDVPWGDEFLAPGATSFCQCSTYFGFIGDNCDESTATVIYTWVASIIIVLWCLIFMCWILYEKVRYYQCLKPTLRDICSLKIERALIIGLFCFFAFFFMLMHSSFMLVSLYDPTTFEVIVFSSTFFPDQIDVTNFAGRYGTSGIYVSNAFLNLSNLQMGLSWMEIGDKTYLTEPAGYRKAMNRYRVFVKIVTGVYLISGLILLPLNQHYMIAALILFTTITFLVLIGLARSRFLRVINDVFSPNDKAARSALRLVQRTSYRHFVILLLFFIQAPFALVLYAYLGVLVPLGSFNFVRAYSDISLALNLIDMSFNTLYIHTLISGIIHNTQSKKALHAAAVPALKISRPSGDATLETETTQSSPEVELSSLQTKPTLVKRKDQEERLSL